MASAGAGTSGSFADLLNPIRDLAKNWDVDIAFHLEEYLAELEMIAITFDGGKTTMNFAQAALLIQGSACIYSKKVDFLYNLVMQLLDVVRCKKTQQAAVHRVDTSHNKTVDSEQFLKLDDYSFAKTTDFKKDENCTVNPLSLLLPKIPSGMLSHKKDDTRNIVLNTLNNDMLGKKNDFFLNSMELVRSGAVVCDNMDISHNNLSTLQLRVAILDASMNEKRSDSPIEQMDDDFPADGPADDAEHFPWDAQAAPFVQEPTPQEDCLPSTNELPKRLVPKTSIEKALQMLKKVDSHEDFASKRKPAIIAPRRTLRVLKTLENTQQCRPSRTKRKKAGVTGKVQIMSASKFCDEAFFSNSSKFPKDNNKLPTCPSFHDKFYEEFKRKKLVLLGIREQLKNDVAGGVGAIEKEGSTKDDDEENMDFGVDVNFDDDDVEDRLSPFTEPDNIEINNNNRTAAGEPSYRDTTATFEDLIRKHTEAFIASTNEHARISSISKKVKQWEESLSPVLDEEDSHVLYDIRSYSTRVLEKFVPNNRKQTMPFAKIISGESTYEVARLFLATLQLANNYNVNIESNGEGSQKVNRIDITLLSHRLRFDNFDT